MNHFRSAPDAVALSFFDRINHGDVEGLEALMTEDHDLRVFAEPPQRGRGVFTPASLIPRTGVGPAPWPPWGGRVAVPLAWGRSSTERASVSGTNPAEAAIPSAGRSQPIRSPMDPSMLVLARVPPGAVFPGVGIRS